MFSYFKNRFFYELFFLLLHLGVKVQRIKTTNEFEVAIPQGKLRNILKKNDLYFEKSGIPCWWFVCYMTRRNTYDHLTSAVLDYVVKNVSKNSNILFTGCGTGGMMLWLGQHGYSNLNGFDYLPNVANAAKELADALKIKANIWQDDGFNPKGGRLKQYDAILSLHWIYSAWMGNYGNKTYKPEESTELLKKFLSTYSEHLSKGGCIIIELIDSIADFKVPSTNIYPVRHSSEQVAQCAGELGLTIAKKMFEGGYGHQPRMVYVLRKE